MTTIAYRAGVLAGDTQVTGKKFIYPERSTKIHRLDDGVLVGIAGSFNATERLLRWLRARQPHEDPPEGLLCDELEALVIRPDGLIINIAWSGWAPAPRADFHAVGSGTEYALVAMRCGKSAPQAVSIAAEFDTKTGGEIEYLALKSTQPVKSWARQA